MSFIQSDERDYDSSFADGLWQSAKASVVMSLITSFFIALIEDKTTLGNTIAYFVGMFFSMSFVTVIITLVFTLSIAYPTRIILHKFRMANDINMALVGGFSIFAILMWNLAGEFKAFYYVIVFWGFVCGYAFMYGYKKERKS